MFRCIKDVCLQFFYVDFIFQQAIPNISIQYLLKPPSNHVNCQTVTNNRLDFLEMIQTHCSLFSLLLGHDLDIDLLQSTMGSWSKRFETLILIGSWLLSDPVRSTGGYIPRDWPATRRAASDWQVGERISSLRSKMNQWRAEETKKGGKAGRRWPGPLRD